MNDTEGQAINGKYLYYGFVAGSVQVLQNQDEQNRINVFPVNDKDTGSNLASTICSVIDIAGFLGINPLISMNEAGKSHFFGNTCYRDACR